MEKKRTRPTWAMVRQLEAEVSELRDTNRFLNELNGKSDAEKDAIIMDLKQKLDGQIEGTSRHVQDCDVWRDKFHALEKEIGVLKAEKELLEVALDDRADEVRRLKRRGLWSRILNK